MENLLFYSLKIFLKKMLSKNKKYCFYKSLIMRNYFNLKKKKNFFVTISEKTIFLKK